MAREPRTHNGTEIGKQTWRSELAIETDRDSEATRAEIDEFVREHGCTKQIDDHLLDVKYGLPDGETLPAASAPLAATMQATVAVDRSLGVIEMRRRLSSRWHGAQNPVVPPSEPPEPLRH